jgi:hypothetical protein
MGQFINDQQLMMKFRCRLPESYDALLRAWHSVMLADQKYLLTSKQGLLKLESDQKSKLIETNKASYNREQTRAATMEHKDRRYFLWSE